MHFVELALLYTSDGWEDRWVNSEHKNDLGKFTHTAGKFYHDAEDKGTSGFFSGFDHIMTCVIFLC